MTLLALQKKYLPMIAPEDFFVLIANITGQDKAFLFAHPEYELGTVASKKAEEFCLRRHKHEPVAYITGHKEFYGRDFRVTPDTLIPRPDTELLVEQVLLYLKQHLAEKKIALVDIGTGSGNIIISLAKEIEAFPLTTNIRYHALDISPKALTIAKENAMYHSISEKISFHQSDLLVGMPLPQKHDCHLIIVANLPYLSEEIYQASASDVRDYEPRSALVSHEAGLYHYHRLLNSLPSLTSHFLSITGFFEISPEQSAPLKEIIKTLFPSSQSTLFSDLSARDRLIQAIF